MNICNQTRATRTTKRMATTKCNKKLMEKLKSTPGCTYHDMGRGELPGFEIEYNSAAFHTWKDHYLPHDHEHPDLAKCDILYLPYPAIVLPPDIGVELHAIGQVYPEVVNTLIAYAPLRATDFTALLDPPVPLELVPTPPGIKFNHSTLAAYRVLERIQTGEGLPSIAALAPGTAIARLNIYYANCIITFLLRKL
jgi:hypothetical protein